MQKRFLILNSDKLTLEEKYINSLVISDGDEDVTGNAIYEWHFKFYKETGALMDFRRLASQDYLLKTGPACIWTVIERRHHLSESDKIISSFFFESHAKDCVNWLHENQPSKKDFFYYTATKLSKFKKP